MFHFKISVIIPYKQRLHNLRLALQALANQTLPRSDFEVVIGAMEYCDDYMALCREFSSRINIVSVVTADPFEIPKARNLGMRQARGQVCLQMDADTLLASDALEKLFTEHFAFGQAICVVGQVLGYGNNNDGDVATVEDVTYDQYVAKLTELREGQGQAMDLRRQVDHVIPWSFAWTGFIALPRATVEENSLFFDESFRGWGVDDLEWGFRISESRTPIVLSRDLFALHLPHVRDTNSNRKSEIENYRRFLRKWPRLDVELACAMGDIAANSLLHELNKEIDYAFDSARPSVVSARRNGSDVLVIGVPLSEERLKAPVALLDQLAVTEVLPLVGLALPFADDAFNECEVLEPAFGLSQKYLNLIRQEAKRVARNSPVWSLGANGKS
jgi:glycosyltransferase involved in cell wall biosynthesis